MSIMESTSNAVVNLVQRLALTIPDAASEYSRAAPLIAAAVAAGAKNATGGANDSGDALLSSFATRREERDEIVSDRFLYDMLVLTTVVVLALELLSCMVLLLPAPGRWWWRGADAIPVRGKHLDEFAFKDRLFVMINKCMTGVFVYVYFGYLWSVRRDCCSFGCQGHGHEHVVEEPGLRSDSCEGGRGIWAWGELSLSNTILPIPFLFIIYDFFYTPLHWFLHIRAIYGYIHKHHHQQKAPSRANIDAVNVHPLEFFLGEFNHALTLHLVVEGIPLLGIKGMDVSWIAAVLFIGIGGALAGLNHTRHDVVVRLPAWLNVFGSASPPSSKVGRLRGLTIFDSKHHDVHHRIPQSNYGQYMVVWDRIFGTFRDYDEKDRINPAYQLDQKTGKSIVSKVD